MAPKALTDCPENLREAIDWLIQVKHGGGIPRLSEALSKLFDNVVQDAEKSLSSLPESDEPSARDVVGKVNEFRSSFPKDSSNTNENILHNLCSSFETFLGYKPPGTYDGSGIVYGSASRLCDAILSFLYRVFGDVRDIQPYVVGGALLSGLVGDLEKARWTGYHGYKTVVPKVASGLRDYNAAVKASNERVKKPIDEIIAYVKNDGGELTPKIRELNETSPSDPDVEKSKKLVEECVGKGKDLGKAFTLKTHPYYMKGEFDDLNVSLRDKIHNARNNVGRETAMLSRWCKKQYENYKAMIKLIKQAFRKLKDNINSKIRKEVTDLVDSLKGLVRHILVQLENISKILTSYVVALETWMKETEKFIDDVLQKQVNEIVKELDEDEPSKNPNHKKDLDEAIKKVESKLGESVGDLQAWKQVANELLDDTIKSSNEVHTNLNHSDQDPPGGKLTTIGEGVKKIKDARQKVLDVDSELKKRVTELGDWNAAAKKALGTAVDKAQDVHGRLDHKNGGGQLKTQIENIDSAKQGLDEANRTLLQQLNSLNTWIDTAENIRANAQQKAQEAYDRLKEYQKDGKTKTTLAANINQIVDANRKISDVHRNLNGVETKLAKWNTQAKSVLDEAVKKAQQVHDALDIDVKGKSMPLGTNIDGISTNNAAIKEANEKLGTEVQHLGKWRDAAKDVIGKAERKCDEILGKSDISDGKNVVIKQQAELLQNKATELLNAYKEAYTQVTGLTKKVQGAVEDLEEGMKTDLGNIRDSIVSKMKEHVGEMLKDIQKSVEKIKGKDGSDWQNTGASGLLGIVSAVHNYATAFRHENFANIAKGWLEATILRYNGVVRRILGKKEDYDGTKKETDIEQFAIGMKEKLNADVIGIAKDAFQGVDVVSGSIQTNINAVKTACEIFAQGLDKELKNPGNKIVSEVKEKALTKGSLVANIKKCVCECDNCKKPDCGKKAAAELIMCALSSTVRQVGNELNSVFLGEGAKVNGNRSIAQELDKVVEDTKTLDGDLENAVKKAKGQHGANGSGLAQKVEQIKEKVSEEMKAENNGEIKVAKTMEEYEKRKTQGPAGDKEGLYKKLLADIPQAMNAFKTEAGLKNPSEVENKKKELEGLVTKIEIGLKEIAGLVDSSKKTPPKGGDTMDGIRQRLNDLSGMLKNGNYVNLKGKGLSVESVKGLQGIESVISGLQTKEFSKTTDIEGAVTEIRTQLKKLQSELKNANGKKDQDVIERLTYMKTSGLGDSDTAKWTVEKNEVDGLGKIQKDLQKQNKDLGEQNKEIKNAIDEIRSVLGIIGFKLDHPSHHDDVIDQLDSLAKMIGKSQHDYRGNLVNIQNEFNWLYIGPFTHRPTEINSANTAIKGELTDLRDVLQGHKDDDVILTLKDLEDTGLSGKEWNNSESKKGLGAIKDALGSQQTTLTGQPKNIETGVQEITGELTRLQKQLNTQVTEKLTLLKNYGLEKGGSNWTIDSQQAKGLAKITGEIDEIKSTDVKDVKHQLSMLCSAIKHGARALRDNLKYMKKCLIGDGLNKIKDQIDGLRSRQLEAAIRECRAFIDRDADVFKERCIADLKQYVEQKLKASEEELLQEARRQYVSTVKEMLKSFAAKVETELEEVPKEIDQDLTIGFKGFMKTLEDGTTDDVSTGKGENINKLVNVKYPKDVSALSSAFMKFFGPLKEYLKTEIQRVHDEANKKKNPSLPKSQEPYAPKLYEVNAALNTVLIEIQNVQGYDHRLHKLLAALTNALDDLKPESFARPSSPLLDGLVEGLTKFAAEFTCAYVSAYAGQTFTSDLVENETATETVRSQGTKSVTVTNVSSLTPYGAMCAKVFLTLLPTLCDAFTRLAEQCGKGGAAGWRDLHINSSSKLGAFFNRCGYKVSTSHTQQDGELRDECNGHDVFVLVSQNIEEAENNAHLKKCLSLQHDCNLLELLKCLCTHLTEYYKTCHLKVHPSPRPPCSVYEMLVWCCGLTYNPVHLTVTHDALPSLFEAPDEQDSADSDVALMNLGSLALEAHPQNVTPASLTDALTEVCHQSHNVLTTLLGYGYAGGIYAVDFNTNPGGLLYPCDMDALLCLFYDVIKRLHQQLYFLYRRCLYNTRHGGWLDCWYGRGVGGSSWRCNTMQCANQICDQQCNQTHNQICNQKCEQHPKCGVKSPLQSFLEDGLQGFLPHDLSANGTCVSCPACDTKSPGLPCKTPMGLSNITRLASRASPGRRIMDALGALCGGASSPLTRLCGYLECLLTRPPRTPDDLFAFFFNLINDWTQNVDHRKAAFEGAVGAACFWQRGVTLDVSTIFGSSEHGTLPDMPHLIGDLISLVKCNGTPHSAPSHPCGPFLKPLGHDVRATFSKEHAHLYLSWVVYLTETFYDLLCSLLQECERTCGDATSTCHARSCANDCPAKRRPLAPSSNHTPDCPSITDCDATTSTLFRLAGSTSGPQSKRTCEDLCIVLRTVLKQMNPLHRLAHDTIPEYLYRIRAPFLFAIIALWLIATLYIAHSLLYRMDVLRLRSHLLTTRASHLIDVKALLAGSRKMLSLYSDVDYFDDPMGQLDISH
ncbi:hypothetical protein, conserved [Babesia ovata]|uniref:Extracellular matrix-binding ebh n=1 Tax=Babesia ovata TaxID=189622 RepID=A0A2H6K899_9APIC|nr:uncharacterized protein BOVATA_007250 [Babesia ovata]GBE59232.1 hypothetical protein, conserved [Babesia ovata]